MEDRDKALNEVLQSIRDALWEISEEQDVPNCTTIACNEATVKIDQFIRGVESADDKETQAQ